MRDGTSDPPQTVHRCSGVGFKVVPTPSVTRIWTFEPGRREQGLCLTKPGKFGQMGNSCRHKCGQSEGGCQDLMQTPLDGRVRRGRARSIALEASERFGTRLSTRIRETPSKLC